MTTNELQQIIGEAQHDILNAYIASRSPNPGLSELGEPLTPDPKTTVEIQDELASMMHIPMQDIVIFMRSNGFRLNNSYHFYLHESFVGIRIHSLQLFCICRLVSFAMW